LRVPIFARSNIYWDGSAQKLTFVPADGTTDNQGYQGVFFKWGSLVGISPVGAFSGSTDIYVPIVNNTLSNSTWKATTGDAMLNDTDFSTVTSNWTSWGENTNAATDIPYMDPSRGSGIVGRDNTWLIDEERNVLDTLKGFRGDICQYIGATTTDDNLKGYRLPTSLEFGTSTDTSWGANGWTKGIFSDVNNSAGYADGTADMLTAGKNGGSNAVYGSAINSSMGGVVVPASGYRNSDGGPLTNMGYSGIYWSGSAYSTTSGYHLGFNNERINAASTYRRSRALPLRCVKK
jgi:hypothetical protein